MTSAPAVGPISAAVVDRPPYEGEFAGDFGEHDSLADLFRQIGYDERLHKQESEVRMGDPRFS